MKVSSPKPRVATSVRPVGDLGGLAARYEEKAKALRQIQSLLNEFPELYEELFVGLGRGEVSARPLRNGPVAVRPDPPHPEEAPKPLETVVGKAPQGKVAVNLPAPKKRGRPPKKNPQSPVLTGGPPSKDPAPKPVRPTKEDISEWPLNVLEQRMEVAAFLAKEEPKGSIIITEECVIPLRDVTSVLRCSWFSPSDEGYYLTEEGRRNLPKG